MYVVRSKVKIYAPIAQLVEQLALNETVVGSNPTGCTGRSAGMAKLVDAS